MVHGAITWGPVDGWAREGAEKVHADGAATVRFRGAVRGKAEWGWVENDPSKILPGANYGQPNGQVGAPWTGGGNRRGGQR